MSTWYRACDAWLRTSRNELIAKPGTKWHLIDVSSDSTTVIAACDNGRGGLREPADTVLIETPTLIKRGQVIPTPGRGAVCARCYKRALPA